MPQNPEFPADAADHSPLWAAVIGEHIRLLSDVEQVEIHLDCPEAIAENEIVFHTYDDRQKSFRVIVKPLPVIPVELQSLRKVEILIAVHGGQWYTKIVSVPEKLDDKREAIVCWVEENLPEVCKIASVAAVQLYRFVPDDG